MSIESSKATDELRRTVEVHGLTSDEVGALINRHPVTVRKWLAGMMPVPEEMLELLQMKLAMKANIAEGADLDAG